MKAVAMKYKVANTLQPFRRLRVADKSGHGGFTFYPWIDMMTQLYLQRHELYEPVGD